MNTSWSRLLPPHGREESCTPTQKPCVGRQAVAGRSPHRGAPLARAPRLWHRSRRRIVRFVRPPKLSPSFLSRLIATGRGRFAFRGCCPAPFHEIEDEIGGADGDRDPAGSSHRGPQPVAAAKCECEADTEPDQTAQKIA